MRKREKIGIIGLGYVGGAVLYWFSKYYKNPIKIYQYDKYKKIGALEEVDQYAGKVFVCVPTPYYEKKGFDDSAISDILQRLKRPKVIILKSTVIPGSTEKFQERFPRHKILFNPEFLVAKTANKNFVNPDRQIIGYTKKSKTHARLILKLLPKAPHTNIMTATEAEVLKYFGNTFFATKVVFANQMYDLCEKLGINYDVIRKSIDPRVGKSHLQIFHDGYRGYSGGCLPKDMKAFIDFAKKKKSLFSLLVEVEKINNRLQKKNAKSKG